MKMKKMIIMPLVLMVAAAPVMACPAWECNYDVSDYSCGGNHGCSGSGWEYGDSWGCDYQYDTDECYGESSYVYDEYSYNRQPLYCQYCGNESWACTCGTGSNYNCNYNYDYDDCGYQESYSCGGSGQMDHWANIRDCYGNVIGQAGAGDNIEVCGVDCSDPDRVLIYDYSTGTYGSVLSDCVYGGYQWDGSGDNGYYNSYQGDNCYVDAFNDCGAVYDNCSGGYGGYADTCDYYDGCAYDGGYDCNGFVTECGYSYVRYIEAVTIVRQFEAMSGCGIRTCL